MGYGRYGVRCLPLTTEQASLSIVHRQFPQQRWALPSWRVNLGERTRMQPGALIIFKTCQSLIRGPSFSISLPYQSHKHIPTSITRLAVLVPRLHQDRPSFPQSQLGLSSTYTVSTSLTHATEPLFNVDTMLATGLVFALLGVTAAFPPSPPAVLSPLGTVGEVMPSVSPPRASTPSRLTATLSTASEARLTTSRLTASWLIPSQ